MNRQLGYGSQAWQDKNLLRSSGLKQSLERPKYQILTLEEILPQLAKAKLFSTLDANDGFYQISLDGESSMKTAFWTPFGRWQYLRVSFGPCTRRNWMQAPWEVRWPSRGSGLSGHGIQREWRKCHSRPWQQSNLTSPKSKRNNPKLNNSKIKHRQPEVNFMGYVIANQDLKLNPEMVEAIKEVPRPTCKKELATLLGFMNYMSKFYHGLQR